MSLAIEVDDVTEVLLTDGWYTVDKQSFELDSYEFMWKKGLGNTAMHPGGQSGICATGFSFKNGKTTIYGPLTSILAVRTA